MSTWLGGIHIDTLLCQALTNQPPRLKWNEKKNLLHWFQWGNQTCRVNYADILDPAWKHMISSYLKELLLLSTYSQQHATIKTQIIVWAEHVLKLLEIFLTQVFFNSDDFFWDVCTVFSFLLFGVCEWYRISLSTCYYFILKGASFVSSCEQMG